MDLRPLASHPSPWLRLWLTQFASPQLLQILTHRKELWESLMGGTIFDEDTRAFEGMSDS